MTPRPSAHCIPCRPAKRSDGWQALPNKSLCKTMLIHVQFHLDSYLGLPSTQLTPNDALQTNHLYGCLAGASDDVCRWEACKPTLTATRLPCHSARNSSSSTPWRSGSRMVTSEKALSGSSARRAPAGRQEELRQRGLLSHLQKGDRQGQLLFQYE